MTRAATVSSLFVLSVAAGCGNTGSDKTANTNQENVAKRTSSKSQPGTTKSANKGTLVVTNSASTSYDPIVILHASGRSSEDIFNAEKRNTLWASRFEGWLRDHINEDLRAAVPEAKIQTVECRASSCRVFIEAPVAVTPVLLHMFPVGLLADSVSVEPAKMSVDRKNRQVKYVLLLRPKHRDQAMYKPWYRARRKRLLREMAAAGGLPLGRKLPVK